jgi:protocatechuate 3,4-dioxygenase beta subunit
MCTQRVILRLTVGLILTGLTTGGAFAQVEPSRTDPPAEPQASHETKKTKRLVNVFKGRVLDSETREPLTGVTVAVADAEQGRIWWDGEKAVSAWAPEEKVLLFFTKRNGKCAGTAETDSEGRFSIPSLKHGTYNLAAVHAEKGLTLMEKLEFAKDAEPLEVILEPFPETSKTPSFVFKGRVLDPQGQPVSDAVVGIADTEKGHIARYGGDEIFVYASSRSDERFAWFSRSRDAGRSGQAKTDENGAFSIRKLRHGSYSLLATHPDKGFAVMEAVAFDEDARPLDVVLEAPAFIEGTVKGLKLRRGLFGRQTVGLSPEGLPKILYLNVDVDLSSGNRFRAGPLPKAEKWTLTVSEYVSKQGYSATLLSAPVRVEPGKTVKLEVDLTKGSPFAGDVRGPEGEVLSGVSVLATAADDSGWAYGAVTGKDGKYTLKGLPDGKYTLEAKRYALRTGPG